jgi:phenylacetate-coenzyme A ligase PaaK-like adenylate-forming protein
MRGGALGKSTAPFAATKRLSSTDGDVPVFRPDGEDLTGLFAVASAFDHTPGHDELFAAAMRESVAWHRRRCPEFDAFLRVKGYQGGPQAQPEDIPPLFVTIFKEHRLISIPPDDVKLELTSSGTGGRKSAIVLDARSLRRILRIVDHMFGALGLVQREERVNYLCFSYDPKIAKNVGTAFSDKVLTGLTRRKSVFYAIRWNEASQNFEFDLEATAKKLVAFARQGGPVRILGFPAYLWQVCDWLEARGITLDLGPRSFLITGGGWKVHRDKEVTKDIFKARVGQVLGVPPENLRDSYGMVEHGIPYTDCERGELHVPIYARARALDPETLQPMPAGVPGLLHLMTPYLSSYPSISLLSTDLATVQTGCACGRPGHFIRILGRAGVAKHKGCAITALEYLDPGT